MRGAKGGGSEKGGEFSSVVLESGIEEKWRIRACEYWTYSATLAFTIRAFLAMPHWVGQGGCPVPGGERLTGRLARWSWVPLELLWGYHYSP